MAEQNKKTEYEQRLRAEAERIVDRFLKVLMSREQEAGWEGDNILGKWKDHEGFIPSGSGFSGFSKVYEQTLLLGVWPARFRVSCRLVMALTEAQREAVCIDRAYRGRQRMVADTQNQRRVCVYWSDKRCAEALGCSKNALRTRICDGYRAIEDMLSDAMQKEAAA